MSSSHLNALAAGYRLQDYVIERVLGQGTFGITYKALILGSNQFVAIKEYFPREFSSREGGSRVLASGNHEDVESFHWGLEKFVEEAKTLTRFDHPNLVSVQRFFRTNGSAYLVMDYCDGEPLDAILDRERTLDYGRLLRFLEPLLDGLDIVHRADVVHRDIKPGNIFIRDDGSPVLLDFGAARNELGNHSRSVTSLATPGYGAPEQYGTRGHLGPWTDIYGLSATLYRCITGMKPQSAPDRQLGDELVPAASAAAGNYPASFLQALDWALELRPKRRPRSVAEWRSALLGEAASYGEDRGSAATSADSQPVLLPASKSRPREALTAIVAALAVGGVIFFTSRVIGERERMTDKSSPSAQSIAAAAPAPEAEVEPQPAAAAPEPDASGRQRVTNMSWVKGIYTGEVVDGVPSGQGEYRWESGIVDKGIFSRGMLHGKGVRDWPDGERHEGQFAMDECSGQGTRWIPASNNLLGKAARFDASWKTCADGQGTLTIGGLPFPMRMAKWRWIDPPLNGDAPAAAPVKSEVKHYSFDGGMYSGDLVDGKPNGRGEFRARDGVVDQGEFVNGKLYGQGTRTFNAGGLQYVGPFKEGKCYGEGVLRIPRSDAREPDKFEANFTDCFSGIGIYSKAEGGSELSKLVNGQWIQ